MMNNHTVSIVIPVFNEQGNIRRLYAELCEAIDRLPRNFEVGQIIYVDDGSTDSGRATVADLASMDERVLLVPLRRNFGKSMALAEGFERAKADFIITVDGDGQDDPAYLADILIHLLAADMVGAARVRRTDNDPLTKTLPSRLYNLAVRLCTGVKLSDMNCGFKAYRREVVQGLKLYGDMHRFIPVLLAWQGYRLVEMPVVHRPRYSGVSKYGSGRLLRGLVDFMTILFLTKYMDAPMKLFGVWGLVGVVAGIAINGYLGWLWLIRESGLDPSIGAIGNRPLFLVGIMLFLFGVQLLSLGLIGEMIRFINHKEGSHAMSNLCGEISGQPNHKQNANGKTAISEMQ